MPLHELSGLQIIELAENSQRVSNDFTAYQPPADCPDFRVGVMERQTRREHFSSAAAPR
jgi:hypothetical protein